MRRSAVCSILVLLLPPLLAGCADDRRKHTSDPGEGEGWAGEGEGEGAEGEGEGELPCVPGSTQLCVCAGGLPGGQNCAADGRRWLPCVCGSAEGEGEGSGEGEGEGEVPDGPMLVVDPELVQFTEVEEGTVGTRALTLFNAGTAPLLITRIVMVNDAEGQFGLEIDQIHGEVHAVPASLPGGLPRQTLVLLVSYVPTRVGQADGELHIESNDPQNPVFEIRIIARAIKPCITITPADADFGDVLIEQTKDLALDLTNCGNAPLAISEAFLRMEETSPDFTILSAPEGLACDREERSCTGLVEIPPEATVTLALRYSPMEEGPDGGILLLHTNVAKKEELEINLFGRGATNACPVAVAEARVAGADVYDEFPADARRLETTPLKTIELRGDRSSDPGGEVASYRWTVLERPEDSTSLIIPHEASPNPTFFLDLAGRYVFELQVQDGSGLPSCNSALVYVLAVPDADIEVQLVWDTPADPDQTDEGFGAGSDMDLHLVHPQGDWFDLPWDCFFENPNPDWGRPGNPDDDPSLDRDDTDGAGPEVVNYDNPENNRIFRVGVHYYNDHGYGESLATVRIFIQGVLRAEYSNKRMPATDYFWDVATISWPGGGVQPIDNLLASAPNGGGRG